MYLDLNDRGACYRAVASRDRRFDGLFHTGVRTTGIYCRPSCPARTPRPENVTYFRTAAAAQRAGFRACRRCLPDATPGTPDWDLAADLGGRAMRLIADGLVDREGVSGLAARLGYGPRHVTRLLTAELGAGPLALARARRAQSARSLVESTGIPFAEVAFASGFGSIRQFNDTMREVYAATPGELRRRARARGRGIEQIGDGPDGSLTVRLAVREPFCGTALLGFLARRAVPGVESAGHSQYSRTLRLPHGAGLVTLDLADSRGPGPAGGTRFVRCHLRLERLHDLGAAIERCRRLLDADCDPEAVDAALGADPLLAGSVAASPGLRVPGHVDGHELAVRAVLGQQVSVRAAATTAGLLAGRWGEPTPLPGAHGLIRQFPSADTIAGLDPGELPMPRARARALVTLCERLASGAIPLDRSADRAEVCAALLALPGVGPWTAGYVAMRALGDPDVFLPTDHGVRRALGADAGQAERRAQAWRPWRSYAVLHLWSGTVGRSGPGEGRAA